MSTFLAPPCNRLSLRHYVPTHQPSFIPQMDYAPSPNWALHMLPPLLGPLLSPFFTQLAPLMRSQFNHHFLREASMPSQVSPFIHSLGLLPLSFKAITITTLTKLHFFVWSSAQCFPHNHTVSSRMTGPCLFCFFSLSLLYPQFWHGTWHITLQVPQNIFLNECTKACMHMEETRWPGIRWVILKTSRPLTRLQKETRPICYNKWGGWIMVGRWVMTRDRKWHKPQWAELFPWHWRSTVPEVTVRSDDDISSTSKLRSTCEMEEWATIACRLEGKPCFLQEKPRSQNILSNVLTHKFESREGLITLWILVTVKKLRREGW